MERKKPLDGIRFNEAATIFAIRHPITNSSSCCNNTGIATHRAAESSGGSSTLYVQIHASDILQSTSYLVHQVLELRGCEPRDAKQKEMKENGTPKKKKENTL